MVLGDDEDTRCAVQNCRSCFLPLSPIHSRCCRHLACLKAGKYIKVEVNLSCAIVSRRQFTPRHNSMESAPVFLPPNHCHPLSPRDSTISPQVPTPDVQAPPAKTINMRGTPR